MIMRNRNRKLLRFQLDKNLSFLREHRKQLPPLVGQWIRTIREALGMTQVQLAKKLHVTPQTINAIEKSESLGTISVNTLKKIGEALGCSIFITFIPHESLEDIVRKQAQKIARHLVEHIVHTMALEAQQPSPKFIEEQIKELTSELIKRGDKRIWEES